MKNAVMMALIVAGILTAVYRFLPNNAQQKVNVEVAHLKSALPGVAENTDPKKYVLAIPDDSPQLKPSVKTTTNKSPLAFAYMQHAQDVQVAGEGKVIKILTDDNDGSRHQRFILRVAEGFTVLVAHNVDLAPRINNIAEGDSISFYGEYVWNDKGGVMHWTHHDPNGRHVSGWLKHNGVTYQ